MRDNNDKAIINNGDVMKYLTIKKVSVILNVTPQTLRNWDKMGRLKAFRHPINNYRLYDKMKVEKIVKKFK